jgi:HlyD family type I secretion membrane fusion protein
MKTPIRIGIATVLLFFGGLGTWAYLAPLDGAVIGSGTLIVHGNRKTIQHREGGIVAELLVRDGSVVEQGQLLVRLDDTQARAVLTVHQSQLLGDTALTARDTAELADAAVINFPPELSADDPIAATVMNREQIVFHNHRNLLVRQQEVIDQRSVQVMHQQAGAHMQRDAAVAQLGFAEDEKRAIASLERVGLASKNRLLELSRAVEGLRGQVGQLTSDVARYGAQAAEMAAEKLRLRDTAQTEATRELREAQLRMNDVLPRLVADRDTLARLEIRAPLHGEVRVVSADRVTDNRTGRSYFKAEIALLSDRQNGTLWSASRPACRSRSWCPSPPAPRSTI